ncbi:polycomb group protein VERNALIZATION 2 [Citrus sinensis]|uniref:Polycomb group protein VERNALIZATION 2 n=1 Tax=Citrus sinensis TaxID=2711 RepID=A0ACB8LU21_CITSI|nr:polycomb group protein VERNALIZATION 2 [Citrus sinensis]
MILGAFSMRLVDSDLRLASSAFGFQPPQLKGVLGSRIAEGLQVTTPPRRSIRLVAWTRLPLGVAKLTMDGCSRGNPEMAAFGEEATAGEERLLIYCKPVELYNILRHRAQLNGLRYHLCSSHDLFNYEFWVTDDYQAVNISVKIDTLTSEIVAGGVDPRLQTFFFCAKPRSRKRKNLAEHEKQVNIQFLELDSPGLPTDDANGEFAAKDDGERDSKLSPSGRKLPNGRDGGITSGFNGADCIEGVASSFNGPDVPIAMAQSSMDPECVKSLSGTDAVAPAMLHVVKSRKLSTERSDPRNRALLSKRLFYHSHRVQVTDNIRPVFYLPVPSVQPMAIEQVTSNEDSEDEVDDDIADFEDRRMLDDFVDVSKDEKQLMHLWNSFVRKQRVIDTIIAIYDLPLRRQPRRQSSCTDWEVVSVSIKILKSKVAQAFNEKDAAVLRHCLCSVLRKKLSIPMETSDAQAQGPLKLKNLIEYGKRFLPTFCASKHHRLQGFQVKTGVLCRVMTCSPGPDSFASAIPKVGMVMEQIWIGSTLLQI